MFPAENFTEISGFRQIFLSRKIPELILPTHFYRKKNLHTRGGKLVTLVKGEKTLLSPPAKFHPLYGAHAHTHTSS